MSVQHNGLTSLPEGLGLFVSLNSLNLAHNNLLELPSAFGRLFMLKYLHVAHNSLTALPTELASIASLYFDSEVSNAHYNYLNCEDYPFLPPNYCANQRDFHIDFCDEYTNTLCTKCKDGYDLDNNKCVEQVSSSDPEPEQKPTPDTEPIPDSATLARTITMGAILFLVAALL